MQYNTLRKVLVTGANKGIGYEIAKGLYANQNPYHVILGSRDLKRGEEALNSIKKEVSNSNNKIEVHQIDVSDSKSIDKFIVWAKESLGKLDVLINNAGFGYLRQTPEEGVETLNTNFFAVVELTEKALSILVDDGKIINVSSGLGGLGYQSHQIRKKLDNSSLTRDQVMAIANELLERTRHMKHTELDWSSEHYNNSKCLLNAYTRFVLPRLLKQGQQCYSCTPGYCRTDMTNPGVSRTAKQGAETMVFIANLPYTKDEKYHTKFFADKVVTSYE